MPQAMPPRQAVSNEQVAEKKNQKIETSRYLICDNKAAELMLQQDPCSGDLESQEVTGYELYIVEQWACERKLNKCVTTFTGNPQHKIQVSVINVPKDTKLWTPIMTAYFDELIKLHLRPKETEYGLLFVTNLSSFPSNLNLVPVPSNKYSISEAWDFFYVNENLKRAGCGGRLVLTIADPSDACEDKFRQVFRTDEKVPITFAVRELVTMVQIGLFYCNLLAPEYVDGLLCNETVKAISAWWDRWGQVLHHTKPKDGVLGPTTVAAIIGFVIGIKTRIGFVIGVNKTPKDPFDASFFIDSIRHFQKHEHLMKTLRIDSETDDKLRAMTDYKMYSNSGQGGFAGGGSGGGSSGNVPSSGGDFFGLVKSTMKEVSGKQVFSLADIETLDLERLTHHLQGSRARYLWLGKGSMREVSNDPGIGSSLTGIPSISLAPTEMTTTSKDLKRAMMRTVTYRKQKTDDAINRGMTKIRAMKREDSEDERDGLGAGASTSSGPQTEVGDPSAKATGVGGGSSNSNNGKIANSNANTTSAAGAANSIPNNIALTSGGHPYVTTSAGKAQNGVSSSSSKRRGRMRLRRYKTRQAHSSSSRSRSRDGLITGLTSDEDQINHNQQPYRRHRYRYSQSANRFMRKYRGRYTSDEDNASVASDYMSPEHHASDSSLPLDTHLKAPLSSWGHRRSSSSSSQPHEPHLCPSLRRSRSVAAICADPDAKRMTQYKLRRQHSFSTVEPVILRYPVPFYTQQRLLELHMKCLNYDKRVRQELDLMDSTTSHVETELRRSAQRLARDYDIVDHMDEQFEQVWAHERVVRAQLQDLDALTSRLQYEARMLDAKLRDVEDAVDTFEHKVSNLEARMDRITLKPKGQHSPSHRFNF